MLFMEACIGADLDCEVTCTAPVSRSTSTKRVISTAGLFWQLTYVACASGSAGGRNGRADVHSEDTRYGDTVHARDAFGSDLRDAFVLEDLCKATALTRRRVFVRLRAGHGPKARQGFG